jgi:hypothetical protein
VVVGGVMVVGLHLLTLQEFGDEMDYIALHAYPEEELPHICIHLLHTRMCTIKCSMGFLQYDASNIPILRDVHPSSTRMILMMEIYFKM